MNQVDVQRPYFPNLDVLRFFAAFLVVFGHSVTDSLKYLSLPYPLNNTLEIICRGGNWVSLFFVLSGFLLGYLAFLDKSNGTFSLRKFTVRRILRIWPLYFIFLLIGYLIIPLIAQFFTGNEYNYTTLPYFLLFIGNFAMKTMYEINDFSYIPLNSSILWSISIEEQFYIVLAVIFAIFSSQTVKWLLFALVLAGLVYVFIPKAPHSAFNYHTFYFLLDFFGGALLAAFIFFRKNRQTFSFNATRLKVAIVVLGLTLVCFPNLLSLKVMLILWFMLIIVYLTFCNDKLTRYLKKQQSLIYLGKISYGIYVIHPIFQYAFFLMLHKYLGNAHQLTKDLLNVVLTTIFTIGCAHLSYKYMESYFLRLKSKFY